MAKGRKHNTTGRSTNEPRFVQVPFWVLESAAACRLSGTATRVLLYIIKRHNGVNNGRIGFGSRSGCFARKPGCGELEDISIGIAPRTMSDALFELEAAGFIRCTKDSTFDQKRMTKEWRLTWLPTGEGQTAVPPTKEFATAVGDFRRQKPGRPRALSVTSQGGQPPHVDTEAPPNDAYRAATRPIAKPHRAAGRPHLVTIPSDSEAASIGATLADITGAVQAATPPSVSRPSGPEDRRASAMSPDPIAALSRLHTRAGVNA